VTSGRGSPCLACSCERDRVGDRGIRTARADVGGQRGWLVPGHGYFFASLPPYYTLLYWQGTGFYYVTAGCGRRMAGIA